MQLDELFVRNETVRNVMTATRCAVFVFKLLCLSLLDEQWLAECSLSVRTRNRENGSQGESLLALRDEGGLVVGAPLPLRAPEVGGCGGGGGAGGAAAQAAFAAFQRGGYAAPGDVALPPEGDCHGGVGARGVRPWRQGTGSAGVRWRQQRRLWERCVRAASCAPQPGPASGWGGADDATGSSPWRHDCCAHAAHAAAGGGGGGGLGGPCGSFRFSHLPGWRRQVLVVLMVQQLVTLRLSHAVDDGFAVFSSRLWFTSLS